MVALRMQALRAKLLLAVSQALIMFMVRVVVLWLKKTPHSAPIA